MANMDFIKISKNNIGEIQVIFGPMFSGKSTELIRRLNRYQIACHSCLIIKYSNDSRYSKDSIATHDQQFLLAISTTKLFDLSDQIFENKYDIIGIDEGQFFPDCVQFCDYMANKGKIVIVAALDSTFERKEFGDILKLIPLAENVVKLNAVCMVCYDIASFSKRITDEKKLEVIGGVEKYMSVCRKCYLS